MKGWLTLELIWTVYVLKVCSSTNIPGGGCYHPARVSGSEVSLNGTVRKNGTYPVGTWATHTCPRGAIGKLIVHQQTCRNNGSWSNSNETLECDTDPCTRWLGSKWPIAKARKSSVCFGLQDDLTRDKANNFISRCQIFPQTMNRTGIKGFQEFLVNQHGLFTKFCETSNYENIVFISENFSPRGYIDKHNDYRDVVILQCYEPPQLNFETWVDAIRRYRHWICLYNSTCSPPSQNEKSEVNYKKRMNTAVNDSAWYKCPEGFSLQDKLGIRFCKEDGQWSRSASTCHYTGCYLPEKVANISYSLLNDSLLEGSLLEQSCPPDMMMSDESRFRRCVKGQWDGEAAECHAVAPNARILNRCSLKMGIIIILGASVAVIVVIWLIVGVTIWRKSSSKNFQNPIQTSLGRLSSEMNVLLGICIIAFLNMIHVLGCNYAKFGYSHTMCRYRQNACPKGLLARGLTQANINAVLAAHNNYRKRVATGGQLFQPTATNMLEMKWNSELATFAQRWADQCTFGHDSNRRTNSYSWVGQNVAMIASTAIDCTPHVQQAVDLWYKEVVNPGFSAANIDPFRSTSGTAHYTQVVWANTDRIGCGFACYKDGNWYRGLYVCNYGPGGNMIGTSMYKKGPAASACVYGKSRSYSGLCNS